MPSGPRVFVDTSVLVFADDAFDPQRRTQARAWLAHLWAARLGRVSTQVLSEYYVCVTQRTQRIQPGLSQGDARAKLRRYQLWQPWVIDHQTVETAWGLEVRHQIDYWQALMLASAMHSGCEAILSDALPLVRYDQLEVINPFESQPPTETAP
jgi:predicted nucleic acid-binding protein